MIKDIIIPSLKTESADLHQGVFVIEPYYPGYGTTVGNALRRILLTSLPGAAVTAVEIKGATHEFTSLDGIKEDLVEVILNLKGIRLEYSGSEPVEAKLKVDKKGEVKASAISLPGEVKLMNADHHIATITDAKGGLEMRLRIESGRGYRPVEDFDDAEMPMNWIKMDAVFSPVTKVSFNVVNTRVGDVINYDKLTLEIQTDGTLAPADALRDSAKILVDQLSVFTGEMAVASTDDKPSKKEDAGSIAVEELNLSARTLNALQNNGVKTVNDIKELGLSALGEMKGLGAKAVEELEAKLKELGVHFES